MKNPGHFTSHHKDQRPLPFSEKGCLQGKRVGKAKCKKGCYKIFNHPLDPNLMFWWPVWYASFTYTHKKKKSIQVRNLICFKLCLSWGKLMRGTIWCEAAEDLKTSKEPFQFSDTYQVGIQEFKKLRNFTESKNILSWKGPTRIIYSNCWI